MKKLFLIKFLIFIYSYTYTQSLDSVSILKYLDGTKLPNTESIINVENYLKKFERQFSLDTLIQLHKSCLIAAQKIEHDSLACISASRIRYAYNLQNNPTKREEYINIELKHALASGHIPYIANAYFTLGVMHTAKNELLDAIENYLLVIDLGKKYEEVEKFEYYGYINSSNCYTQLGEYKQSNELLKLAELYYEKQEKMNYELCVVYTGMVKNYFFLNDTSSTELYFSKLFFYAKKFEAELGDEITQFQEYNINNIYLDIIDYYLATENLTMADSLYKESKNFKLFDKNKKYKIDLGYARLSNKFEEGEALIHAIPNGLDTINNADYFRNVSAFYEKKGDYKKSFDYFKKYKKIELKKHESQQVNLSTYTNEKIKRIEQSKQLEYLEKEKIYQKKVGNLIYVLCLLLVFFLALSLYVNRQMGIKNQYLVENREKDRTISMQNQKLSLIDKQKSKLFTNLSHELQTPLSIIQGFGIEVLKSKTLVPEVTEAMNIIIRNSNHLSEIVDDILSINHSKEESNSTKFTLFSVKQFIQHIFPNYHLLAQEKGITLDFINYSTDDFIYSDFYKIDTVIKNLLSNAIKYTQNQGTITLSYSVANVKDSVFHKFEVRDNGKGISELELPNIFDRYYQSESNEFEGGFGIGLAVCKEYIESIKGMITVSSKLEEGTTFTAKFPKSPKELIPENAQLHQFPLQEPKNPIILSPTNEPKSDCLTPILIVEDNRDYCKYLETILKLDYKITFVHDGQQAINYLKNNGIELIITDWMMPNMDGISFIQHLKSSDEYTHIPVLMLTARSLVSDKIKALRIGTDDYLLKPVQEEVLKKRISQLLSKEKKSVFESDLSINRNEYTEDISTPEQNWLIELEQMIFPLIQNPSLNLKEIASLCNIESTTLNRKIKAITGMTAKKYIQEIRYWEARRLLETGKYHSVKVVGFSVGFKDIKYFSRKFKERFGDYPSSYIRTDLIRKN